MSRVSPIHTVAVAALVALAVPVVVTTPVLARTNAQGEEASAGCAPGVTIGELRVAVGGQYRLLGSGANVSTGDAPIHREQDRVSFASQRYRNWVNIHDRRDCRYGAYAQVEIGYTPLGTGVEFPKTFVSGGEGVGIELRRGFLWYKPTPDSLVRAGILAWEDRFGERPTFGDPLWSVDRYDTSQAPLANSVWDFNVGGITLDGTIRDSWHYALGALVLQRGNASLAGEGGTLLMTADLDRSIGTSIWGGSVYYLRDRGGYSYGDFGGPMRFPPTGVIAESPDLWIGARGHIEHRRASTALFAIVNRGEIPAYGWTHAGWAAKVATTLDAGPGTVRLRALFSSGDGGADPTHSGEFRTVAQSVRDNRGAQSYWSLLGLTSPRGPSDGTALGIGLQNEGLGLLTVQAGYERPLNAHWTATVAAGWLRADQAHPVSGSPDIGTEFLAEARWQMATPMALDVGVSVLATGDFFKSHPAAAAPATLYELYGRWQLEF